MLDFVRLPRRSVALGCAVIAAMLVAKVAVAQRDDSWDYRSPGITRPQLEQILARYQAAAQSPAYSAELRASATRDADSIRARLAQGDLRVGDHLRMSVEGQTLLSDTFTVSVGPVLILPAVGSVDLRGVLRSELQDRVAGAVDSVYRNAVVRVEVLTRLAVIGGVPRPGFYALPRQALVDDAVTAAGGLAPDGRLAGVHVERGPQHLWRSDSLRVAMSERRTIGDLGLQSGDEIVIPTSLPSDPARTAQTISYIVSVPLSIYALLKLF